MLHGIDEPIMGTTMMTNRLSHKFPHELAPDPECLFVI